MPGPKYRKGSYVTNTVNGMHGKIVDSYKTPRGFEYTLLISGTRGMLVSCVESNLIRQGDQSVNKK